eukprot:TRINITY_DN44766_c0_g1_i1.p2 TRINITY_DN44766_c0_g1~~TRINITY_DN44766_c0_g1_i1.p2  ORF type:complete len:264 (-),score=28.67 TRINITY_DN44766_c0_g1_i1:280-1071(-)
MSMHKGTPSDGTETLSLPQPRNQIAAEARRDGFVDSTETELRYLAYFARLKTVITHSTRYLAYSSDVGEAVRPVVNPNVVRACYGISWVYVLWDVTTYTRHAATHFVNKNSGRVPFADPNVSTVAALGFTSKSDAHQKDSQNHAADVKPPSSLVMRVAAERFVFQALASMALPAFTIHSMVTFLTKFTKMYGTAVQKWAPTAGGMAVVPFLPFMFDHSVEVAVGRVFEAAFGSPSPSPHHPEHPPTPIKDLRNLVHHGDAPAK